MTSSKADGVGVGVGRPLRGAFQTDYLNQVSRTTNLGLASVRPMRQAVRPAKGFRAYRISWLFFSRVGSGSEIKLFWNIVRIFDQIIKFENPCFKSCLHRFQTTLRMTSMRYLIKLPTPQALIAQTIPFKNNTARWTRSPLKRLLPHEIKGRAPSHFTRAGFLKFESH